MGINRKKFWRGLWEVSVRSLPPRVLAIYFISEIYFSRDFNKALKTVRTVSQTPDSRNLDTWTLMNRRAISQPKETENVYRTFAARLEFGAKKPLDSLLLELAYLIYKRKRHL